MGVQYYLMYVILVVSLVSIPTKGTSLVIPAAPHRCLEYHPTTFQTALDNRIKHCVFLTQQNKVLSVYPRGNHDWFRTEKHISRIFVLFQQKGWRDAWLWGCLLLPPKHSLYITDVGDLPPLFLSVSSYKFLLEYLPIQTTQKNTPDLLVTNQDCLKLQAELQARDWHSNQQFWGSWVGMWKIGIFCTDVM